jgi:hypothetical protein
MCQIFNDRMCQIFNGRMCQIFNGKMCQIFIGRMCQIFNGRMCQLFNDRMCQIFNSTTVLTPIHLAIASTTLTSDKSDNPISDNSMTTLHLIVVSTTLHLTGVSTTLHLTGISTTLYLTVVLTTLHLTVVLTTRHLTVVLTTLHLAVVWQSYLYNFKNKANLIDELIAVSTKWLHLMKARCFTTTCKYFFLHKTPGFHYQKTVQIYMSVSLVLIGYYSNELIQFWSPLKK